MQYNVTRELQTSGQSLPRVKAQCSMPHTIDCSTSKSGTHPSQSDDGGRIDGWAGPPTSQSRITGARARGVEKKRH
eukprot:scaffold5975_cov64-Cyclotella_meneghiniana.AAC.5